MISLRCRLSFALSLLLLMMAGGIGPAVAAAEPAPAELPRFPAVEPADALRSMALRSGVRLELAAHEPEVMDPIAISFDERGRAYVVEMRDYSERRPERLGRIRRLEDRDGDGRMETSTVFLDGLPWPTAVTCWDDGVWVGATPDLWFAADRDGDGRAEVREIVFTGFASQFAPYATNQLNVQALMNSFQWGPGCRIHGSSGLSGGKVTLVDSPFTRAWRQRAGRDPAAPSPVIDLSGRDFSFDPRTLELRGETGGGQYGMTFNDDGEKFVCSNSDHLQWVRIDERPATVRAGVEWPARRVSIAADGPAATVFRLSPEEPWRVLRTRWRVTGLVPGLIEGGGRSSGYFTSATGLQIYRGDALPDLAGDAFVADCGSNLLHRKRLRRSDGAWMGERAADEQGVEFLASRDTWFRPVQLANAPDGCLWILDMYREVIEHPWSLPPALKRLLDLNSGSDRGRLYRVVPAEGTVRRRVDLSGATLDTLVTHLGHANGWHRDTAQRLLFQRAPAEVAPVLRDALRQGASPLARRAALDLLAAGGTATAEEFVAALDDPDARVRRRALRLSALHFNGAPLPSAVAAAWTRRVEDTPEVRLELALGLAEARHPQATSLIAALLRASAGADQGWLKEAAVAAAADQPGAVLAELKAGGVDPGRAPEVWTSLARLVGRRQDSTETTALARELGSSAPSPATLKAAAGLLRGRRAAGAPLLEEHLVQQLAPLRQVAVEQLSKPATPSAEALDALELAAAGTEGETRPALLACLEPAWPEAVRQVALERILGAGEARALTAVVERWERLTPEARATSLELALRRPATAEVVLAATSRGSPRPGDFSAAQVAQLRSHPVEAVRSQALRLFGAPSASRHEAVAAALPALDLQGDPARGREVFRAQCATCHRLGGEGHALGPDLESVRHQPAEKLLVAIVDPSREVAPNYLATAIETTDGESLTGLGVVEPSGAVVLRQAGGLETRLEAGRIQARSTGATSLMPEGFETTLTAQQLADLLSALTGAR